MNENASGPKTAENFEGKYTESGVTGGLLLKNFFRTAERMLLEIAPESVLEVACGSGFSTREIRRILPSAHFEASDYYTNLIEKAKKRVPGVSFSQESIYELQREPGSFDLVVAFEVLEHLEDPTQALHEIERVTRRYALLSVPREPLWRALNMVRGAYWREWGNTPGHINHWSRRSFEKFIESEFRILKVQNPLPWTMILAEKVQ